MQELAWLCEHPNVFTYIVCNTSTTRTRTHIRLKHGAKETHRRTHGARQRNDGGRAGNGGRTCVPGIRASGCCCVCASLDDLRLGLTATVERGRRSPGGAPPPEKPAGPNTSSMSSIPGAGGGAASCRCGRWLGLQLPSRVLGPGRRRTESRERGVGLGEMGCCIWAFTSIDQNWLHLLIQPFDVKGAIPIWAYETRLDYREPLHRFRQSDAIGDSVPAPRPSAPESLRCPSRATGVRRLRSCRGPWKAFLILDLCQHR